jgi:hypothetical protein
MMAVKELGFLDTLISLDSARQRCVFIPSQKAARKQAYCP